MSVSVFSADLEWSKKGHMFLAKQFYPTYAYKGQFVYCDRADKKERGALLINKKLHVDTIIQHKTPLDALCIDEKIVRGYYTAFTLETHSVSDSPRKPSGIGKNCIVDSWADELLYVFPTEKDCNCTEKTFQKCDHRILSAEAYIINLPILADWFSEHYDKYPWCNVRNQAYWTHVRIVSINEVYRGIGKENISQIILSQNGLENEVFYMPGTKQLLLFPFTNETPFFRKGTKLFCSQTR